MAKKVLLIDDDESILELLRLNLAAKGFDVSIANGGKNGLEKAASIMPDAIVMDVQMPGMNGWDACKLLKSEVRTKAVPILFISGSEEVEASKISKECGGAAFISKPFDTKFLISEINRVIGEAGK